MIAKALIFAVFCVQAIRFDDKAELASLSALISKLKPKTKNTVGLGNTTGTVLSEVDESAGNGGTIKDLLNEIKNSIIDNKKDAIKQEADHCTDSVDGSVGETELDFGDSTKYFDLVGCDETSTCETGTDKEQTIATDAHARIQALEAALADLENKLKIKQAASTAKTGDIEALEKKKTDNDALHQIRMKKFGDAITILNKIDSGLDESGKITMPEFLQLSKEEKKAIQNFRVGAAMLLVLDQATSGVGEKDLVQQLKTLLASCISSLETSKANEVKKHDDWIGFIEAELGGAQKEGEDIVTEIANLQGQILANKQETAAEEKKKADAIKISNSLRQTCLDAHSTYISDLAAYDSEIAAIEEMIKILIEAKLDDQTTAIRDETDLTKHGVEESLDSDEPDDNEDEPCTGDYTKQADALGCTGGILGRCHACSLESCKATCNVNPDCIGFAISEQDGCDVNANTQMYTDGAFNMQTCPEIAKKGRTIIGNKYIRQLGWNTYEKELCNGNIEWVLAEKGGISCDETCASQGRTCKNPEVATTLDTFEKAKAAFAKAGFNCVEGNNDRDYAGKPDTTAIHSNEFSGYCYWWPATSTKKSSCDKPEHGVKQRPLCACSAAEDSDEPDDNEDASTCEDKIQYCDVHKKNGGCLDANHQHDVWRKSCVKTCGYCDDPKYNPAPAPAASEI